MCIPYNRKAEVRRSHGDPEKVEEYGLEWEGVETSESRRDKKVNLRRASSNSQDAAFLVGRREDTQI